MRLHRLGGGPQFAQIMNDERNFLIVLDNPPHRYHGNHWYHICEHFLARSEEFHQQWPELPSGHVFLFAANEKFLSTMTTFTFFLLILTFWFPKILSLTIVKIPHSYFQDPFSIIGETWEVGSIQSLRGVRTPFHYSSSKHIYNRFLLKSEDQTVTLEEFSGQYLGSFGEYPISSFYWFQHGEVPQFRNKMRFICHGSEIFEIKKEENFESMRKSKKTLVVYQRDQTRQFLQFDQLLTQMQKLLDLEWEIIPITHSENRNPCFLYHLLHQADGFLSLHGFQFTAIMFLPPQANVIEIFPYKYYKPTYYPLAKRFGLNHIWFQAQAVTSVFLTYFSLETCMKDPGCRSFARNQNVLLSFQEINAIVNLLWIRFLESQGTAVYG